MNNASENPSGSSQPEEQRIEDRSSHRGNQLFQAWLKGSINKWFIDYLQRVSYGETTADQFRMLLYHLQELDEKHQVIVNPRQDRMKEILRTNPQYGKPESEICLRGANRKDLPREALERMCEKCKIQFTIQFQACQEVKEERRNALR